MMNRRNYNEEVMIIKTTTIRIQDNGPYQLEGKFEIIDDTGERFEVESSVSLCRCGYSENKPFCDGTHEVIHFESTPRVKDDLMVEV